MKRTPLFLFMIILVACTSNNNSSGRKRRSKAIDVSEIEFQLQPRIESSIKEEAFINVNSSYSEEVKKFQVPVQHYTIDANMDTNLIVGKRGTVLHIPENIMVDKTGNPYKGDVQVHFKEYTNSAEIAFSGIPMTFHSGKEELRFNSAGMFEITATSSTEDELFIARGKSISVDYKLVKQNPGTDFYRLDEGKNEWKKISNIVPPQQSEVYMSAQVVTYVRTWQDVVTPVDGIRTITVTRVPVYGRNTRDTLIKLENGRITNKGSVMGGMANLNATRFGMYNCDQAFRLVAGVTITASYKDKETKRPLKNLQTLSLIDLSYNGAFSFSPSRFICDASARNVLVLFTQTGELYYLDETSFKNTLQDSRGICEFEMTNVSHQVKNTEDLQKLLGI